ncbi:MAG: hypothetical protein ABJI92_07385 [Kangiellaceae bacterium]
MKNEVFPKIQPKLLGSLRLERDNSVILNLNSISIPMQYTTIALAAFILLFALFTAYGSIKNPKDLVRLVYMRSKFGIKAGTIIHTLVYVLVPAIFGYFMLMAGFDGKTITQFITQ